MVTWKKTLISALAATIVGAGATGAALAASGRHSGNDRRVDNTRPAVLDSHGTGISDDGNGRHHENGTPEPGETPEAGDDNGHEAEAGDDHGHEAEAGDDNSSSGPSDNQGPGENSGPGEDSSGNSGHDGGGDDGGGHGGDSGSDG